MSLLPLDARTTRLLYLDIFWQSILAGTLAFNGAYVLRLGASNTAISLMSALPSLAAIFIALPAGYFLQARRHPRGWTLLSLGVHWLGFLLLAVVPWVRLPGLSPGGLAVLIIFVFAIPSHVAGIGIPSLLAEVIPEPHRIRVFATRNLINSVVVSGVTLAVGAWLTAVVFPINYQVIYVVGWVCGLLSLASLARIRLAARTAPAGPPARLPRARRGWRLWPTDLAAQPNFRRVLVNSLWHQSGLWLASPLLILRYVRELDASDAWLGLHGTVMGVSTIVGLVFWRWAAERLREPRTLRLTILSLGLYPLLVGVSSQLAPILVFAALNGFFVAGVNLSHGNILLQSLPEGKRPEYMGVYSTIINTGAFICPLVSVAAAGWLGIGPTLVVCGVWALLGALSYWIWRVPLGS